MKTNESWIWAASRRVRTAWKIIAGSLAAGLVLALLTIANQTGLWQSFQVGLRYHDLSLEQQMVSSQVNNLWRHANLYPSTDEKQWRELQHRIDEKTASFRRNYEDFLQKNPLHYVAMTSYAVFLEEIGRGHDACVWRAYAFCIMPRYAPLLNDMANACAHRGRPLLAIQLYEAAVQLEPGEGVYHFNLGNMYCFFREEGCRLHGWKVKGLLANALEEFRIACSCDRTNFEYAICYAETFYGMNFPLRHQLWQEALAAWDRCLEMKLASDQRDFVQVHMVRVSAYLRDPVGAMNHLSEIRNAGHRRMASRLLQKAFPESFAGLLQI